MRAAILLGILLLVSIFNCIALAHPNSRIPYYFIANTRPPDAYLALRTHPSSSQGQRITTMPNGTLLQVLHRQPDGWWYVRVVTTGQEGWALSASGKKTWIYCCRGPEGDEAVADSVEAAGSVEIDRLHTPETGSPARKAIMNAARIAQHTSVTFKVNYLSVYTYRSTSIAMAELQDAKQQLPYGGLMFFEAKNGQWRALYSMYMEGSESCEKTVAISNEIFSIAKNINAPRSIFPQKFFDGYKDAMDQFGRDGDKSDCATTARY